MWQRYYTSHHLVSFTIISATGIRSWILRNLPHGVAHGTGIGIGLFLLLIAANCVGLVIKNPLDRLPVALGDFTTFPVMMSLVGLAVIIGLEKLKVPGGILLTIIGISIVGLIFECEYPDSVRLSSGTRR